MRQHEDVLALEGHRRGDCISRGTWGPGYQEQFESEVTRIVFIVSRTEDAALACWHDDEKHEENRLGCRRLRLRRARIPARGGEGARINTRSWENSVAVQKSKFEGIVVLVTRI